MEEHHGATLQEVTKGKTSIKVGEFDNLLS